MRIEAIRRPTLTWKRLSKTVLEFASGRGGEAPVAIGGKCRIGLQTQNASSVEDEALVELSGSGEPCRKITNTPRGVEQMVDSSKKTEIVKAGGAESGAVGAREAPTDPSLAVVVEAWPALPEPVKARILAMIQAAG